GTMVFERYIKKLGGQGDADAAEVARGEAEFHQYAHVLNAHLAGRDWIVGNAVTLADISVGAWMTCAAEGKYPAASYSQISRWYENPESLPAWQASVVPLPAAA